MHIPQLLIDPFNKSSQIRAGVLILQPPELRQRGEKTVIGTEVVAEGDGVGDMRVDDLICVDEDRGFVGPGSRDVPRCVSASADDEKREVECFHVGDAGAVRAHIKIETA